MYSWLYVTNVLLVPIRPKHSKKPVNQNNIDVNIVVCTRDLHTFSTTMSTSSLSTFFWHNSQYPQERQRWMSSRLSLESFCCFDDSWWIVVYLNLAPSNTIFSQPDGEGICSIYIERYSTLMHQKYTQVSTDPGDCHAIGGIWYLIAGMCYCKFWDHRMYRQSWIERQVISVIILYTSVKWLPVFMYMPSSA